MYKMQKIVLRAFLILFVSMFLVSCFYTPIGKPTVVYPKDGDEGVDVNVTLSWKVEGGAALKYDLYLSDSKDLADNMNASALIANDLSDTKYTVTKVLKENTWYYWRVVAKDDKGGQTPGDVWRFKTKENNPPSSPVLISPKNGETNLDQEVILSWNAAEDIDGDTLKYDVYFSKDYDAVDTAKATALEKADLDSTQLKVEGLEGDTWYYWRVAAKDDKGGKSFSEVWKFKTKSLRVINHPPNVPSNPKPRNGDVNIPLNVKLSWDSEDMDGDMVYYDVYFSDLIGKVDSMSLETKIASGISNNFIIVDPLAENKTYYWRVVAKDDKGNSSIGPIWRFTTLKILDEAGYANSVFVKNEYLYSAMGTAGMVIYKIIDKNTISEVARVNTPGCANDVYVKDKWAYVADGDIGITVVDVSNPEDPQIVKTLDLGGYAKGIYIKDSFAYIATWDKGLSVVDITEPSSPKLLETLDTDGKANDVYVEDTIAYVANGNAGVTSVDVSSPSSLEKLGEVSFYGYARKIFVKDNYAYIACWNNGLIIADVSDPKNIKEVYSLSTNGKVSDVFVKDDEAYVADYSKGLIVLDITNPTAPFEVTRSPEYLFINNLYVSDDVIAIAQGSRGVKVIDIDKASNRAPAEPFSPTPDDGKTGVSVDLDEVSWEAYDPDGNTMYFDVYFSNNYDMVNEMRRGALIASSAASTKVSLPILNGHSTYYWRVVAKDSYGKTTIGPVWKFTTENRAPEKPVLQFPENRATNISTVVLFTWKSYDPDDDPLVYDLYLSPDVNFAGGNVLVLSNLTLDRATISNLSYHTTYYWKVVAKDSYGGISVSDVNSFTTINNSPYSIIALNPENGATDVSTSEVTLRWMAKDLDDTNLTYDLYVSESVENLNGGGPIASNLRENNFTLRNLKSHTVYYWKIVAKDTHGGVVSGPVWWFETENTPPEFTGTFTPADGTDGLQTSSVNLKWSAVDSDGDEVYYDLYFSDDSSSVQSNDSNVKFLNKSTQTDFSVTNLKGHTTYYWKVIAYDDYGGKSESNIISFTTENNPPSSPTYIYPENAATVDTHVSLVWTSGTDIDGDELVYYIYITDDQSQIDSVTPFESSSTSFTPSNLLGHTTYYWKVVVSDGHGGKSEGDVWSFTTKNRSPETPYDPDPENGETNVELNKVLSWNGGDPDGDDVRYWVYLSTDKNLVDSKDTSAEIVSDSELTSVDASNMLDGHTTYYWKVVAKDGRGGISESPTWVFETQNRLPEIALTSPENSSTAVELSTNLTWSANDMDGDELKYDVYLSSDITMVQSNDNSAYLGRTENPSMQVYDLDPHTKYYWKVVVYDGWGSTQSDIWEFETLNRPPTVTYVSPTNGSTQIELETSLAWNGSDPDGDRLKYTVYLSTDKDSVENLEESAAIIKDTNDESCSVSLQASTVYYWRVVADDGFGRNSVGPVWSFTTRKEVEFKTHGNYDTAGFSYIFVTADNYGYVADNSNGLVVLNISDVDNITKVKEVDTSRNAKGLWIDKVNNYAYIASDSGGMDIFDITDPTNPSSIATYPTSSVAMNVVVDGNYAYIADDASGLVVVDVSDPSNPTEKSQINTSGNALSVFVHGDYAYIGNKNGYFDIIDISGLPTLSIAASVLIPSGDEIRGIFVDGDYAYITDISGELTILDVSNASNPTQLSQLDVGNSAYGIYICDGYAYVGTGEGIIAVNIKNPTNPYIVNSLDTSNSVVGIYVAENYMYIAEGYSGVLIVEIY